MPDEPDDLPEDDLPEAAVDGAAADEVDLADVGDAGDDAEPLVPDEDTAHLDADMVAHARRRHGAAGGILAAGMLGLDQVLGRKPKEEVPVVVAANSDPLDIDADGIVIDVDDERTVVSPPLPRAGAPIGTPIRKRVKRRREP